LFDRPPTLWHGTDGEVVVARTFAVVKIEVSPTRYTWGFVPADFDASAPQGSGRCHDNPPLYIG
jgi:hypothetical protein